MEIMMKNNYRGVEIFSADELATFTKVNQIYIGGEWVPARPLGLNSIWHRIKCAWEVFKGRADLVYWKHQ